MVLHALRSRWLHLATFATVFLLTVAPACRAADASAWDGDERAAARLVNAGPQKVNDEHVMLAGIELRLAPGWKTYWRYPGDSGVPPHFDFAKSENVKSVKVDWPAPHRFTDAEGNTIGYKSHVVLPLRVELQRADQPAVLRVDLDYAVCERLCVPAQAHSELALAPGSADMQSLVTKSEQRVPKAVPLNAARPFVIRSVKRIPGSPARVSVDVATSSGAPVELFAEGPTPDWALPLPEPVAGAAAGEQRFLFTLDGVPPGAKTDGAQIRLTAISGDEAIETIVPLD